MKSLDVRFQKDTFQRLRSNDKSLFMHNGGTSWGFLLTKIHIVSVKKIIKGIIECDLFKHISFVFFDMSAIYWRLEENPKV